MAKSASASKVVAGSGRRSAGGGGRGGRGSCGGVRKYNGLGAGANRRKTASK